MVSADEAASGDRGWPAEGVHTRAEGAHTRAEGGQPRILGGPARAAAGLDCRPRPVLAVDPDALAEHAARLLGAASAQLSLGTAEILLGGYGPAVVPMGARVVAADGPTGDVSFLGVPVCDAAGQPVGALTVHGPPPGGWTAEHAATLTSVAALLRLPPTEEAPAPGAEAPAAADDTRDEPPGGNAHFLHALLESLGAGVIACAADGTVVLVNRPVREFMNLPAAGALDDYPTLAEDAFFDQQGRRIAWADTPLQRAARGERVADADMTVRIAGRRDRVFATTARPIVGPGGRRLGAVAIAHEVTALRRAERFRALHTTVDRVLKSAGSAEEAAPGVLAAVGLTLGWPAAELWMADEDTGELRHAGGWCAPGSQLGDILGNTPIKGAGITGRVWASGRPLFVPDIADTGTLRSPLDRSRAAACLRHGIRTVLSVPVRDGGTVLGVLTCYAGAPEQREDLLTVLLDGIAAQLGVYVALRRAEQLARQLGRAKDDFIALVGHEMRTPITSIVASAAMLGEDVAGLDEENRALVEAVLRNAAALRTVVDTLLDLAGLDSGYVSLAVRRVDLAAVVTDAAVAAVRLAAATGVRIEAARAEPLWLSGDPDRLRQVVDDLLANAVKFSLHGGDVRITLTEPPGAGVAELTVADDGIGTPAEEHDRVFDRFYRGSNVRHQGIAGNGLGLSLARTIVHRHGGTIRLTGRRPHGTAVVIRLPLAGPPGTPGREVSSGPTAHPITPA